jgi:membrane associated rhomboid family serine protease
LDFGVIYALAFFLLVSGFIRHHIPLMAISFIVIFLYGSMVWHLFPWQPTDTVSWEGHLFGAIIGVVLAFVYRNQGPQKPVKIWEEESSDEEEYWNIPLEDEKKLS